ncbi:helix-turn-helix transcriptional regulator [Rhizobium sp. 18065]|uniref:helix-turn-helix domain-containing protein n=1 Tax=Rhizobium sp. 18065 TaxID=2681411 RepID=UPI0013585DEC|nr:helix-turn-helix transcriptional regulator [Rhizobium sp. 18065]
MPNRNSVSRMIDSSDDTLGGRLSAARDAAGISLVDLANRLGVRKESLLNWEADRCEPRPSRLIDLAGILGVSPMWLITGHGYGPLEETDELPLEALHVQLRRLNDAHQECGRLIRQISQQIERYEDRQNGKRAPSDLDGPVIGRA